MVALVPDSSQCASRWPRKLPALVKVVAAVVCVVVLDHVCLRRLPPPPLRRGSLGARSNYIPARPDPLR